MGHLAVVRCGVEAVTGGRILQSGDAGNIVGAAISGSQGLVNFDNMQSGDAGNIVGAAISGSQGLVNFDNMVRKGAISASINSWQTLKAGLLFGDHH